MSVQQAFLPLFKCTNNSKNFVPRASRPLIGTLISVGEVSQNTSCNYYLFVFWRPVNSPNNPQAPPLLGNLLPLGSRGMVSCRPSPPHVRCLPQLDFDRLLPVESRRLMQKQLDSARLSESLNRRQMPQFDVINNWRLVHQEKLGHNKGSKVHTELGVRLLQQGNKENCGYNSWHNYRYIIENNVYNVYRYPL